jgi:xanthine dehydrogenase accessory factor
MALEGADWPLFGWADDVRPAMAQARAAGRPVVLATLWQVTGSAPRGAGAQMLFDGAQATGYFSGDCIEGDVAAHAADVLASGEARQLHYGTGSPWIDIRLRCGGSLRILLERVAPDCPAAEALLAHAAARQPCLWSSDGKARTVTAGDGPLLAFDEAPFRLHRRFDPPRRVIVSGGDPGALALAALAAQARFETVLVRPDGPAEAPPLSGVRYLRQAPTEALASLKPDRWTAYIGATHEDEHDLAACLRALRARAGWVGMIGAKSRAEGRLAALRALGASEEDLSRLRLGPGIAGLGKAPWEVAVGIVAEVMQALNPAAERA